MARQKPSRYHRNFSWRGRSKEAPELSGDTFLVVVEGQETETQYFKGLRDWLKLKIAQVVVLHPNATDPLNLVREAIKLRDEREKLAAESELAVKYDQTWVVFDREAQNHPRREQMPNALALAKSKSVETALSNPCFEFWLLLHYLKHPTTKSFADTDAVIADLEKHIPNYESVDLPLNDLLNVDVIKQAVRYAKYCRRHWKECGGDGNPSTEVDLLVVALNEAASATFKLF